MRYTFDATYGALYVYLVNEPGPSVRQVDVGGGVVVDLGESGVAEGIEILSPLASVDVDRIVTAFGLSDSQAAYLRFVLDSVVATSTVQVREVSHTLLLDGARNQYSGNALAIA